MLPSHSEGVLDASISFGRRTSTRLPQQSASFEASESEQYDFLALMTAVAELYAQEDILEMQGRRDIGKPLAHGAVSEVSRIYAAVTQPSTMISHQVQRRNHVVVIKKSAVKLFLPNGQFSNTSAMRSFISELRILSHKAVREHPNIIRLLGVNWDYFESVYPEPLLLLEKANTDLATFQSRHRSLPFETKKSISLDIARGLSALHQIGVIHGDLKPQNVLIFKKPALHAKIADFSHSVLDTGEIRTLVGGTFVYSAPEWKKLAATEDLLRTDIYSYGLVFGGLMLGAELSTSVRQNPPYDLHMSTEGAIRKLKEDDHMKEYLFHLVHLVDQENLNSDLHEFPHIYKVFESTVQLEPKMRNLDRVLEILGDRETGRRPVQRIDQFLALNAINIPYHALQSLSPIVMDQVIRTLLTVAASPQDTRRAAAQMELAVCRACNSIWSNDLEVSATDSKAAAVSDMLSAADLGDVWARAVVFRVSQALGANIPARYPVKSWLSDAASKGSRIALESLLDLDPSQAGEILKTYRTTFCGNPDQLYLGVQMKQDYLQDPGLIINSRKDTVLHWVASTGNEAMLEAFLSSGLDPLVTNSQNSQGDTPILCAVRSGHFRILKILICHFADASILNIFSENPLHFLTNLDHEDIPTAARLLVDAGAELDAEATGDSGNSYLDPKPRGKSCPRLRAIFANNPLALRTLLVLTREGFPVSTARLAIPLSSQKLMLAWALRLHHFEILEVLDEHFRHSRILDHLSDTYIWNGGRRYSLPALCILGCVSGNSSSGFDAPEELFRILTHGKCYIEHLEKSLLFLSRHECDVFAKPCVDARNALFYAIATGRTDALRFLSTHPEVGSLFDSPYSRWARCKEINGLLTRMDLEAERKDLGGYRWRVAAARADTREDSSFQTPDRLVTSPAGSGDDSDDSYDNTEGNSESNKDKDHLCSHFFIQRERKRPRGHQGRSRSRVRRLTRFLLPGETPGPIELTCQPGNYNPRSSNPRSAPNDANQHDTHLLFNYHALEGIVDAVLMSILYAKRRIFYDLVSGVARNTVQTPRLSPFFVSIKQDNATCEFHYDNEAAERMARDHTADNLIRHFPVHVWHYSLTTNKEDPGHPIPIDGIIRYPLLYMTAIARSRHRDIFLATTLLSAMREMNVPYPIDWTAKSAFESDCLAIDKTGPHATPLYHAAYLRWEELAILLMENGATPQGFCWREAPHFPGYIPQHWSKVPGMFNTVLGRLGEDTDGASGQVRSLLTAASSLKIGLIVTLADVESLLASYPSSQDLTRWEDGILHWNNYYRSPPFHYNQLWDAIREANASQRLKFSADSLVLESLAIEAVQRRDIVALEHVLDFGMNVNQKFKSSDSLFASATALDMVSWTAAVKPVRCSDSGLDLKEHDRTMAEFLVSRGATRGLDYVFEYLLGITLLKCIILPIGGSALLSFFVYLLGSKAVDLSHKFWEIRYPSTGEKPGDEGHPSLFVALLFLFGMTMAAYQCVFVAWLYFETHFREEYEEPFTTDDILRFSLLTVFWFANFIARSTVKTSGRRWEAFCVDILSDLCVSGAFGCVIGAAWLLGFFVVGLVMNPLSTSGEGFQGRSSADVVWGASRSVLWPHISQWGTRCLDWSRRAHGAIRCALRERSKKWRRSTSVVDDRETEESGWLLDQFSNSEQGQTHSGIPLLEWNDDSMTEY